MYERLISLASSGGVTLDADAQAFLTATGITDGTITTAINNLVIGLKADGIWTKMYAIYPIVGGTAGTHKYNLKDPQDTDGAYRITFSGTITHSSSGMAGNGSTGFGNTHLVPSTVIPSNEGSCGAYGTPYDVSGFGQNFSDMGCRTTGSNLFVLNIRWSDNNCYYSINGASVTQAWAGTGWNAGAQALVQQVRKDASNAYIQVGSIRLAAAASAYASPNNNAYVMAENLNGTTSFYSNRTYKFFYFGKTLSTTEMDNYSTRVATFQTDLGR